LREAVTEECEGLTSFSGRRDLMITAQLIVRICVFAILRYLGHAECDMLRKWILTAAGQRCKFMGKDELTQLVAYEWSTKLDDKATCPGLQANQRYRDPAILKFG
jgi:hypothetical protein